MKIKLLTLVLAMGLTLCLQAQEPYPEYKNQGAATSMPLPSTSDEQKNTLWWIIGTLAGVVSSLFGLVIWQNNRLLNEKDRSYERERQRTQEERTLDISQFGQLKELQQANLSLSGQTLELVKDLVKDQNRRQQSI